MQLACQFNLYCAHISWQPALVQPAITCLFTAVSVITQCAADASRCSTPAVGNNKFVSSGWDDHPIILQGR